MIATCARSKKRKSRCKQHQANLAVQAARKNVATCTATCTASKKRKANIAGQAARNMIATCTASKKRKPLCEQHQANIRKHIWANINGNENCCKSNVRSRGQGRAVQIVCFSIAMVQTQFKQCNLVRHCCTATPKWQCISMLLRCNVICYNTGARRTVQPCRKTFSDNTFSNQCNRTMYAMEYIYIYIYAAVLTMLSLQSNVGSPTFLAQSASQ